MVSRFERALVVALLFAAAFLIRAHGNTPPFDDLYHLKRIRYSAAHFPAVLDFDPSRGERGAFCPWPPLFDLAAAIVYRIFGSVRLLAPVVGSLFVAVVGAVMMRRYGTLTGLTAALTVAFAPEIVRLSRANHFDHHFVEPILSLAIVLAVWRKSAVLLAVSVVAALFVQPAMLAFAGVAFFAIIIDDDPRWASYGFAAAAIVVILYRLTRPDTYPDSAWFLGFPHAATLGAASVSCALKRRAGTLPAIAIGALGALAMPRAGAAIFESIRFFGSDPWLDTVGEFDAIFSKARVVAIARDVANLTGGCVLALALWRRYPAIVIFVIGSVLLSISGQRFLVEAIPVFAIGGALYVATASSRARRIAGMILTCGPPIIVTLLTDTHDRHYGRPMGFTQALRSLPPGRVLGPWQFGHSINVDGNHAVIADNFGWMPGESTFINANSVLLTTHPATLEQYCRTRNVRYLVLTYPDRTISTIAETLGIAPEIYDGTALARRTVWSRLYHRELNSPAFSHLSGDVVQIWKVNVEATDLSTAAAHGGVRASPLS